MCIIFVLSSTSINSFAEQNETMTQQIHITPRRSVVKYEATINRDSDLFKLICKSEDGLKPAKSQIN